MNHRDVFASLNFPRWLMPGDYHYSNWNLASVKGFLKVSDNIVFAYGNVGIWQTDSTMKSFKDFNKGFPKGVDHRKTFTMLQSATGRLFAGTLFGLFEYDKNSQQWEKVELPEDNVRVVKLLEQDNKLIILSRSVLFEMPLSGVQTITTTTIPPTGDHSGKAGMFRTFWVIHSGEIFGITGKLIVDLVGLAVIFMTLSGFFYTFLPKFSKKIKDTLRKKLQKANRKTINWHTLIGVYGLPILLVTVITGMFLRPPLLIPIVNKEIKAIPGTILASENVWHDKLRDIVYDSISGNYIISTSEGFIGYDKKSPIPTSTALKFQPPVSVMGINAFEHMGNGNYVVASFSGIYSWNPHTGLSYDMITGAPVQGYDEGNPFGKLAVAGVLMEDKYPVAIMDYAAGWMKLSTDLKPEMPDVIASQPISWWNLALEIHTGRIFAFIMGDFYILYVPLMGLTTLLIIITGLFMYLKSRKRKSKQIKHGNIVTQRSTKSTIQS